MRLVPLIAIWLLFAPLAMAKAQFCVCHRNLAPVCGSDNSSYANVCLLHCQAKATGRAILVAKRGYCEMDPRNFNLY